MKKWIAVLLSCILGMSFCGCSGSDVTDHLANAVQAEDPHVLSVKGGSPVAYPDITYGEAFDNFFGSPTWKYFVGTKEGPDEDGDGRPDYEEEGLDIVEFTGYCQYSDVEVKALLQFTLQKDGETFDASYLSFNDVPQSELMLIELLSTVFTDEGVNKPDANGGGKEPAEDGKKPDTPQESKPTAIDYDAIYDGFVDEAWAELKAEDSDYYMTVRKYDIDKDGALDLILEYGTFAGDTVVDVFTADGTDIYSEGSLELMCTMYECPGKNGVYAEYSHGDYQSVYLLTIEKDGLMGTTLYEGERDVFDESGTFGPMIKETTLY